jgi:hypothetical protein
MAAAITSLPPATRGPMRRPPTRLAGGCHAAWSRGTFPENLGHRREISIAEFAPNWRICARMTLNVLDWQEANIRRSVAAS